MVTSYRHLFDIPREVAFLTAASYSPLPKAVQAAGNEGVARKGQPWRIDRKFRNEQNERARGAAARLIGAKPNDVALVPSVSYGFATVAQSAELRAGHRVLVLTDDHASPVLAWEPAIAKSGAVLETVAATPEGDWTGAVVSAINRKDAAPIAAVSISMVHWKDGAVLDMAEIGAAARSAGALLAIDATQAVGAVPIDVARLDPDFMMFPTYKWLLGPYGRAFFYVAPRHQDAIPLEQTASGRRNVNSEALTYLNDTAYVRSAHRFDMGERDHFITMGMASVGMELVQRIGVDAIAEHAGALTRRVADAFPKLVATPAASQSPHILSLAVEPERATQISAELASQDIHVSPRLGRVRVSPHIYNDEADVDRLIAAMKPMLGR